MHVKHQPALQACTCLENANTHSEKGEAITMLKLGDTANKDSTKVYLGNKVKVLPFINYSHLHLFYKLFPPMFEIGG
jgi:hypothetical protein